MAEIDLTGVDPKNISSAEFAELLAAASAATSGDDLGLSALDPKQFAWIISRASAEQITEVMSRPELRNQVLDEIFRRMERHFLVDKAGSTAAVVHWRIGGRPDREYDQYEMLIGDGTCTVARGVQRDPRLTLRMGPTEFLELVSGNANGVTLFMSGKLSAKGDLGLAAALLGMFDIPKP